MKTTHPILSVPTSAAQASAMAAELLEHHRARFGDLRMEAADDDNGGGDDPEHDDAGDDDGLGFPANTPVKDMTAEQQASYWKHQSRKHEQRAESRRDYDSIKAERDQLRQAGMSEAEKAIEQARDEGRAAGRSEAAKAVTKARIEAALARKGLDDDRISALVAPLDHTHFLTESGEVDTDKVNAYAGGFATADSRKKDWPDMGQGRRDGSAGKESGKDLHDRYYGGGKKQ